MAYSRPSMGKRVLWGVGLFIMISAYLRFTSRQDDTYPPAAENSFSNEESTLSKEDSMKLRTYNMRKACSQYPARRRMVLHLTGKKIFYISEKHKLSYCRVAKVGSTFWTQVFMGMSGANPEGEGGAKSVFDIPRVESHEAMKKLPNLNMPFNDPRVHTTTSFLVSRNPYSRLFSTYIDQIYLPNKWELAMKILGKENEHSRCGNDVTFDEFLDAITTRAIKGGMMDLHWSPIYSICEPCKSKFDYLAKQETFNEDAEYILNKVGVPNDFVNEVKSAGGEHQIDIAIPTFVHTFLEKGHAMRKGCISELDLAKRIWKAFQIQGYIHDEIEFPEDKFKDIDFLDEKYLTKVILEAISDKKLTSEARLQQRHRWQVSFWKKIALSTLQKVQDVYYEDFLIFQYDLDPNTM